VAFFTGFLAIASVSTPSENIVIDLLYNTRKESKLLISEFLENETILKPVCGWANDAIKLRRNWGCFAFGVVEIQHLYSY
jgi:hypothetical protein